MKCLLKDLPEY